MDYLKISLDVGLSSWSVRRILLRDTGKAKNEAGGKDQTNFLHADNLSVAEYLISEQPVQEFEQKKASTRSLLDLVHDLAPSATGRNKLQDALMLDMTLDLAGQDDVVIIDRGVNVRAAKNRVAAKQIRDRIVDPPVALGLLVRRLWRFR